MLSRILSNLPRWLAPAVLALGLAACGGGGGAMSGGPGMGPQACSTCGNALVTLTDAPGDFASYTVNVTSLTLTKADGTVVETLPVKTTVDFTQLVNVTELVSSAAIPQGEYVAATMTLDYSSASIFVYTDANNTQSVQVAQVQDDSTPANVLWSSTPPAPASSTITVNVKLDNKNHLFITPGKLARLALDFNVAQSNTVDLSNPAAPVVTVLPALVASVVPRDTKDIRVRGALASVDTTNNSYTVDIAPFDDHDAKQGQVVVQTTATTTFEVDGVTKNQADGLAALAADGAGTMTVAFGTLSKTDHTFTAVHVLAGSSVQSAKLDRLQGVVTSRSACPSTAPSDAVCLVVHAGRVEHHEDGDCHFSARDVALTIGGGTTITSAAAEPSAAPALSWPSVGSKITVFGARGADSQGSPTFDATAGRLRVELTSLWGLASASGVGSGQVTLSVQAIENLPVSAFTFAGTGMTAAQDSNPQSYVVATGALPLPAIGTSAAALRFFGLVQPFGSAPPDFNARTLVNFTGTSAVLAAGFGHGSAAALTVSAGSLVLNVGDPLLGWMHYIKIGPQLIDLKKLTSNVTITPDPASTGPFVIRSESSGWKDSVDEYGSASDFVTALGSKLASGALVEQVFAVGQYDQTSNTLTAEQVAVNTR